MKRRTIFGAFAALSFSLTGLAHAQGHGPQRGGPNPGGRDGDSRDRGRPGDARGHDDRRDVHDPRGSSRGGSARRDDHGHDGRNGHNDHNGRGAGPDHNFYRGGRLPPQYRNRQYVVDNWRGHHLSPPPRGYHWVQAGADYVLIAIATGVIAQILLSN